MLRYTTRPLSDRGWVGQQKRETSRFTAGWTDTLDLLEREYTMLKGTDLVIEVDVPESGIRNDGLLRSDARTSTPAVVVAFESMHGPLLYRCDRYNALPWKPGMRDLWQHNVRAVALTLEALRAVDRYGASESGEQYRGYKAIGAGTGIALSSGMTQTDAEEIIERVAGVGMPDRAERLAWVRQARARSHPDLHEGRREQYDLVDEAVQVLKRAGKVPA
jgi:hypothetical protein